MNTMTYKGYTARVEYDERDNIFVGRILGCHAAVVAGRSGCAGGWRIGVSVGLAHALDGFAAIAACAVVAAACATGRAI